MKNICNTIKEELPTIVFFVVAIVTVCAVRMAMVIPYIR
jgi:hypothetical protein